MGAARAAGMRVNIAGRWAGRPVIVVALTLSACVGRLEPAGTAQLAPGEGSAATATVDGVTVVARANAWRGFPSDLDRQMTPILLTIRNDRAAPVAVKLGEIALVAPTGRRFAALPPQAIEGSLVAPASALPYAAGGIFWAGPREADTRDRPFPFGWEDHYDRPAYATIRLPTRDMLARALPDGPIQPGQPVQGFAYFERVGPKGTSVDLVMPLVEMPLVDPNGGRSLRDVRIPFEFK